MSRTPRLWLPQPPDGDAAEGVTLPLPADEAEHARRVLRVRPGDAVRVFDGAGREWRAELCLDDAGAAAVRLGEPILTPVESALGLSLIQATCRSERLDWVVQKATEIGVTSITLLPAARSRPLTLDERRLDRWRRIAREAAKQSGRRRFPRIERADRLPAPPANGCGLLLHGPETPPLAARLRAPRPAEVSLAVGPEGGWDEVELNEAERAGWLTAGLGPRTLRAETAGVVAAALVLHAWGDLGSIGPD